MGPQAREEPGHATITVVETSQLFGGPVDESAMADDQKAALQLLRRIVSGGLMGAAVFALNENIDGGEDG